MNTQNTPPTLQNVRDVCRATGLPEAYWWIRGGDLNRPTVATLGIGAHVKTGAYVWISFGDNPPVGGWKTSDLALGDYEFHGPIPGPDF